MELYRFLSILGCLTVSSNLSLALKIIPVKWDQNITFQCEYRTNNPAYIEIWTKGTSIRLSTIGDSIVSPGLVTTHPYTISASEILKNKTQEDVECQLTTYNGTISNPPEIYNVTRIVLTNKTEDIYLTTTAAGDGGGQGDGMPDHDVDGEWRNRVIGGAIGGVVVGLFLVVILSAAVIFVCKKWKQIWGTNTGTESAGSTHIDAHVTADEGQSHGTVTSQQCTNVDNSDSCPVISGVIHMPKNVLISELNTLREVGQIVKETPMIPEPVQCTDVEEKPFVMPHVGICSAQEVESVHRGGVVAPDAPKDSINDPEPSFEDFPHSEESTLFKTATTTAATPRSSLRRRHNGRTGVKPQEGDESSVQYDLSYFTTPPAEVSESPDPDIDEDTVYDCNYESHYSSAFQETLTRLPQKSAIVCGNRNPVTSGWDYSDPMEEEDSFDRVNYCNAPGLSIPSTHYVVDRNDSSSSYDPAPFYHMPPASMPQDLCNIHINNDSTVIPRYLSPHQLGSWSHNPMTTCISAMNAVPIQCCDSISTTAKIHLLKDKDKGQLTIAIAVCNSAFGEEYHTEGAIKEIKEYYSEEADSNTGGILLANPLPMVTDRGLVSARVCIKDTIQTQDTDLKLASSLETRAQILVKQVQVDSNLFNLPIRSTNPNPLTDMDALVNKAIDSPAPVCNNIGLGLLICENPPDLEMCQFIKFNLSSVTQVQYTCKRLNKNVIPKIKYFVMAVTKCNTYNIVHAYGKKLLVYLPTLALLVGLSQMSLLALTLMTLHIWMSVVLYHSMCVIILLHVLMYSSFILFFNYVLS